MSYLIDTNIIIYKGKSVGSVNENFSRYADEDIAISVLTYGELLFGVEKSQNKEKNLAVVNELIKYMPIINVNPDIVKQFARLKAYMQSIGKPVDDADLLIASTAIAKQMTLVTHNTKHFIHIPDLCLADWV